MFVFENDNLHVFTSFTNYYTKFQNKWASDFTKSCTGFLLKYMKSLFMYTFLEPVSTYNQLNVKTLQQIYFINHFYII